LFGDPVDRNIRAAKVRGIGEKKKNKAQKMTGAGKNNGNLREWGYLGDAGRSFGPQAYPGGAYPGGALRAVGGDY
jgi:hypothetical protein